MIKNSMKGILLVLMLLLVNGLHGCIDSPVNNGNNNATDPDNGMDPETFSLTEIALMPDDVDLVRKSEQHFTEPYFTENAAGHNKNWSIIEHYQSHFSENISGPITPTTPMHTLTQSITRLESKEKAQEYVSLKKPSLMESKGYMEMIIGKLGDDSFFLNNTIPASSQVNETFQMYLLCFCIEDVVVTLGGASTRSATILNYAKIVEQRLINKIN
jgi:hypothetical protein